MPTRVNEREAAGVPSMRSPAASGYSRASSRKCGVSTSMRALSVRLFACSSRRIPYAAIARRVHTSPSSSGRGTSSSSPSRCRICALPVKPSSPHFGSRTHVCAWHRPSEAHLWPSRGGRANVLIMRSGCGDIAADTVGCLQATLTVHACVCARAPCARHTCTCPL